MLNLDYLLKIEGCIITSVLIFVTWERLTTVAVHNKLLARDDERRADFASRHKTVAS